MKRYKTHQAINRFLPTVIKMCLKRFLWFFLGLFIPAIPHFVFAETLQEIQSMDLVIHVIDVGVGDAIFIELPDRDHEILIDGGDRRQGFDIQQYLGPDIDGPLELVVITHSDFDHWSGIERLITSGQRVLEVWDPGYDRECKFSGARADSQRNNDQYLKFVRSLQAAAKRRELILKRPVPVDPVHPLFEMDNVKLSVLHADPSPPKDECSYMVNDASVVIRMQYKEVSFLFTGDANGKKRTEPASVEPTHVEKKLLDLESIHKGILRADVLKVPHHGSESASTYDFVHAVAPKFALISSSVTAKFRLPADRVLQQYQRARFDRSRKIEKVLRTNEGERSFETKQFGDDHIICGTNGKREDLVCDYIWNFDQ